MSIDNIRSIVKRLTDMGVACGHTLRVANHFAHGGASLFEDLLCMVKNDPIEISYDGRVIELKS